MRLGTSDTMRRGGVASRRTPRRRRRRSRRRLRPTCRTRPTSPRTRAAAPTSAHSGGGAPRSRRMRCSSSLLRRDLARAPGGVASAGRRPHRTVPRRDGWRATTARAPRRANASTSHHAPRRPLRCRRRAIGSGGHGDGIVEAELQDGPAAAARHAAEQRIGIDDLRMTDDLEHGQVGHRVGVEEARARDRRRARRANARAQWTLPVP